MPGFATICHPLEAKETEARWVQELATYEFQVIHRFGKKHGKADGLSQIPCTRCGRVESTEEEAEAWWQQLPGIKAAGKSYDGGRGRTNT